MVKASSGDVTNKVLALHRLGEIASTKYLQSGISLKGDKALCVQVKAAMTLTSAAGFGAA